MVNEERRKIQLEALEALDKNNYSGAIILPTGTGKSYVLIEALKRVYKPGMKVLYTCDSQRLRDTDFNNELAKWDAEEYCDLIQKECYASAYKYEDQHWDILLADEGDYGLTPQYSKLFLNNTFSHIIFVSATLEPKKRTMARKIVPIVYEKKLKEIEEKKVINKTQFYFVPYVLNEEENRAYNNFNDRFHKILQEKESEYREKRLQFLTYERISFLQNLKSSAYICRKLMAELHNSNEKSKMLVFCGSTDQADIVSKYSYHTKNQKDGNLDKFNNGEIWHLAVCGKVDRGINLNGVNTVVMEFITRSETRAIQKFGRGKRLDVDEILESYILIPYYKKDWNKTKNIPTIVLRKAQEACANLGIENAKTYIVK